VLNIASYRTSFDGQIAATAGSVHLEQTVDALWAGMTGTWTWVESLLSAGVRTEVVSSRSWQEAQNLGSTYYPPGNYSSTAARMKMWELTSYYMAMPSSARNYYIDLQNAWYTTARNVWLKAQEANVGHPRAGRYTYASGTAPNGSAYTLYARDFDRALILNRPNQGWSNNTFNSTTAVRFTLPSGERWYLLNADGTIGSTALTSVTLMNAEAAILIKGSTIGK
jgi:hypothetical protein